jgi:energy-coupling factor transporter transmembrane protein EcfT
MILSLIVHLSNFPLLMLSLVIVLLVVLFSKRFIGKRKHFIIKMIAPVLAIIIAANILMNYNYSYFSKYQLSTTSHVFFLARLIDSGVIEEYLEDNCGKYNFTLCQYKNEIPRSSQLFIWGQDGPYYKTGSWSTDHEDYKIMIRDILTTPKYLKPVLFDFTVSTFKQLFNFKIGEGIDCPFDENSAPVQYVLSKFPKSEIKRDLLLSEQNTGNMNFREINILHYLIIFASLIAIIYVILRKKLSDNMFLLSWVILSGLVFNAAVCADLSNVLNRYQSRVIWLLPLLAILLIAETFNFKNKNEKDI